MDELLRQAYERRERLRRELALVDNLISDYERLESTAAATSSENYELSFDSRSTRGRSRTSAADLTAIYKAAEALILKAGKPLSRSDLLRRLEANGFQFPGRDKVKVFGTNLWRSKRFVSLKGLGYWPEAHPLPAAYQSAEQRPSMLKD